MDGRRQAWVVSCIGEPTAEIEDALTDEVAIAFGRHVLRLACAELGRTRDECRAESRPLGKREIAIAGRREHHLARIQPNHAIRAVIDEAIRAREAGESKVIPFNLCGHGHFDMQAYHAFLAGRLPEIEFVEAALADGLTKPPGDPGPGIAPLRTGWTPNGDAEVRVGERCILT